MRENNQILIHPELKTITICRNIYGRLIIYDIELSLNLFSIHFLGELNIEVSAANGYMYKYSELKQIMFCFELLKDRDNEYDSEDLEKLEWKDLEY